MKLKKSHVGRLCLTKWDDVGRVEGLIVEVSDDRKDCRVYEFNSREVRFVEPNQIVEIGELCTPNSSLGRSI